MKALETNKEMTKDLVLVIKSFSEQIKNGIQLNENITHELSQKGLNIWDKALSQIGKEHAKRFYEEIPKDITRTNKHKVDFGSATRIIVVVFFIISTGVFAAGLLKLNDAFSYKQEANEMLRNRWTGKESSWLFDYYQTFKKKHPNDTKRFIQKKGEYPLVNPQ